MPLKEILALTGYVRGGCSPLAMKKQYPTFLDSRALDFDFIVVSAGVRGLQLKLAPHDLAAASRAKVGELIIS